MLRFFILLINFSFKKWLFIFELKFFRFPSSPNAVELIFLIVKFMFYYNASKDEIED